MLSWRSLLIRHTSHVVYHQPYLMLCPMYYVVPAVGLLEKPAVVRDHDDAALEAVNTLDKRVNLCWSKYSHTT